MILQVRLGISDCCEVVYHRNPVYLQAFSNIDQVSHSHRNTE